jgi:large subunit ribosomal protein L16
MQPKNRKYRKDQKGSGLTGIQHRAHRLAFGPYGLKSLESNQLKACQLEAVRKVIIRRIRKIGQI